MQELARSEEASESLQDESLEISQTVAQQPKKKAEEDFPLFKSVLGKETDSEEENMAKAIRESGLAWSAGIALFASIVFMMVIGWIIDTLLETAPVGIVVGIIIGSIVGFYQFFRITSQILK